MKKTIFTIVVYILITNHCYGQEYLESFLGNYHRHITIDFKSKNAFILEEDSIIKYELTKRERVKKVNYKDVIEPSCKVSYNALNSASLSYSRNKVCLNVCDKMYFFDLNLNLLDTLEIPEKYFEENTHYENLMELSFNEEFRYFFEKKDSYLFQGDKGVFMLGHNKVRFEGGNTYLDIYNGNVISVKLLKDSTNHDVFLFETEKEGAKKINLNKVSKSRRNFFPYKNIVIDNKLYLLSRSEKLEEQYLVSVNHVNGNISCKKIDENIHSVLLGRNFMFGYCWDDRGDLYYFLSDY